MMKLDDLLDIMVPLDFGLEGKNAALRRGLKLLVVVLVVAAIAVSAVEVLSDVCPEGMADWYLWVMVAWRVFLHSVAYFLIVVVLMFWKGTLKDVADGGKRPAAGTYDDIEENIFFSSDIDEEALIAYIKSNPDKFASGENMAIFFLIMSGKGYIGNNMKKLHEFLSSLIACSCRSQLSIRCGMVKEILESHSLDETRRKLIIKYDEMEKILSEFVIRF